MEQRERGCSGGIVKMSSANGEIQMPLKGLSLNSFNDEMGGVVARPYVST